MPLDSCLPRGRNYYVNMATQKVTWKHPTVTNQRGKFGQAGKRERRRAKSSESGGRVLKNKELEKRSHEMI